MQRTNQKIHSADKTKDPYNGQIKRSIKNTNQKIQVSSNPYTWLHLDTLGYTWIHLDTLGYTWIHLDALGYNRIQSDTIGYSWIHLDTLGYTSLGPLEKKFSSRKKKF